MSPRERFRRVLNFEPVDRLPVIEWAFWWDQTLERWYQEGLPRDVADGAELRDLFFGQDPHRQLWIGPDKRDCPPPIHQSVGLISNRQDYLAIRERLYPERTFDPEAIGRWAEGQRAGEMVIWITLEGFFWFPRGLFGIEPHLFAFYDQPDLMKQINEDLLAFNLRVIDQVCEICVPDFMTFAEDMSYNHGPMLSKVQFDEFMAPYYRRITPVLRERGIVPFVDTDGDVTDPVAWFLEVGMEGFLPLERMAGVDVAQLRRKHPRLKMIGAFDKTVMHRGEERIRAEFDRLLPVMLQGGYIPSVDHQTPPEVSLEQYRLYLRVLREYCERAGSGA